MFIIILQFFNVFHYVLSHKSCVCVLEAPVRRQELKVRLTNLTTCTISASTDFYFLFFLMFDFFLIHISQIDVIMTTKHDMHEFFFVCFCFQHGHNRGDIQLRFKQNKHHPFKPIFFPWFFSRQMHHCFSFIKILYSQKKRIYIFFISPVTVEGRGQQPSSKLKHLPEYFVKLAENTWQRLLFLLLHTALIHYSSAWHEFLHTDNVKSLYFISTAWIFFFLLSLNSLSRTISFILFI